MIGRWLRLYPRTACRLEYFPSDPRSNCQPLVKSGPRKQVKLKRGKLFAPAPKPLTKRLRANALVPQPLESRARRRRAARRLRQGRCNFQNLELVPTNLRQESGIAKQTHHYNLAE